MGIRAFIDHLISKALVIIMAVMVINVLWQVFTRFVLDVPSSFTDELARYLMIWLGVLGAAYVSGRNGHVAIDVLARRTSPRVQKGLSHLVSFLIIAFVLTAFIIGGARLVYISYILGQHSPALRIPLAMVYLIIPISGIFIIYYKIADILKN